MLIELIGRAKEEIALQAHALDFSAGFVEYPKVLGAAIKRASVVRSIEAKLYCVHTARIKGKGSTANNQSD